MASHRHIDPDEAKDDLKRNRHDPAFLHGDLNAQTNVNRHFGEEDEEDDSHDDERHSEDARQTENVRNVNEDDPIGDRRDHREYRSKRERNERGSGGEARTRSRRDEHRSVEEDQSSDRHRQRSSRSERNDRDRDRDRGRDSDRDRDRDRYRDGDRENRGINRTRSDHTSRERPRSRQRDNGRDRDRDRERRDRSRERYEREEKDRYSRDGRRRDDREHKRSRYEDDRPRGSRRSMSPLMEELDGDDEVEGGTTVVPIQERKRPLTDWDVPPKGFEGMTVEQVKNSGAFIFPGASSRSTNGMIAGTMQTPMTFASLDQIGPVTGNEKQARRLYVGGIPDSTKAAELEEFFNRQMITQKLTNDIGMPVVSVQMNTEKQYAFVELRTAEEASKGMALDGVLYKEGAALRIRRPKDFQGTDDGEQPLLPGVVSTTVPDSEDKLFIGGLPSYLTEEQVLELLQTFGPLRAFNLVKDNTTNMSKGFAFALFMEIAATDNAIKGLHDMELVDKRLVVQRANTGGANALPAEAHGDATMKAKVVPSRILQLHNMLTEEELSDATLFDELYQEIEEEVKKFGIVKSFLMPAPDRNDLAKHIPGLTKVFVEYSSVEQATATLHQLAGRAFGDSMVLVSFYDEDRYHLGEYE